MSDPRIASSSTAAAVVLLLLLVRGTAGDEAATIECKELFDADSVGDSKKLPVFIADVLPSPAPAADEALLLVVVVVVVVLLLLLLLLLLSVFCFPRLAPPTICSFFSFAVFAVGVLAFDDEATAVDFRGDINADNLFLRAAAADTASGILV